MVFHERLSLRIGATYILYGGGDTSDLLEINESTLKSLKGEFCIWFFCKIQMIFCHNELFRFDSWIIENV